MLYALEASSDYDPGPALGQIKARLLAINFADDLINPPELGVLEREIKRVQHGRAILTAAMMLAHLGCEKEAHTIEAAVLDAVRAKKSTQDAGGPLGTKEVGEWIAERVAAGKY